MRQVPDIAAVEIKRLRELEIKLSDDDIVWLSCLAYQVENPHGQTIETSGISNGVLLSNGIRLKPLTIKASEWLKRYGCVFTGISELYAVAYAMANSTKISTEHSILSVVDNVKNWGASLNVSMTELENAVSRILADDTPKNPDAKPMTPSEIIGLLVAATGLPAEHWNNQTWEHLSNVYSGIRLYASMFSETQNNPEAQESRAALKYFALAIQEISNRGGNK
jgi:hypothetical protein